MQLVWIPFILWQKWWFEVEEPWKIWKLICKAPNRDESGTKCCLAGLVYLRSAAILSLINYNLKDIPVNALEAKYNTGWFGWIQSLQLTISKYKFAIILKIKVAINNNIQSFVSLRPWIKYSGCLHWIMLNQYKISDGFCLDTFYAILMYRDTSCRFLQKMMGFL